MAERGSLDSGYGAGVKVGGWGKCEAGMGILLFHIVMGLPISSTGVN